MTTMLMWVFSSLLLQKLAMIRSSSAATGRAGLEARGQKVVVTYPILTVFEGCAVS